MGSGVDVTQFRGVSVSNAGHVQFQNVPESRPEDTTDISRIPARKTVCVCLFVCLCMCLFVCLFVCLLCYSLLEAGDPAASHDSLISIVDVDAEKQSNSIEAVLNITLHMFLRGRGREMGEGVSEGGLTRR